MKVLIVEPRKAARVADIDNDLETLQEIVGGYIETVSPFRDDVVLIVNEEGKLKRLPPCRTLVSMRRNTMDTLSGTIVIAGVDPDEGEFRDLTAAQTDALKHRFDWPTVLVD